MSAFRDLVLILTPTYKVERPVICDPILHTMELPNTERLSDLLKIKQPKETEPKPRSRSSHPRFNNLCKITEFSFI